ncbi:MAG: TlpA family protein disulfide reductase [Anaerolineae bacterium]
MAAAEATFPITRRRIGLTLILAALGLLFLLLLYALGTRVPGSLEGRPAPDFTLALFDGREISLSDLRGQVVVVNFWASWCSPCRKEAPLLEEAWRSYGDRGVVFLGVDYVDTESEARAYLRQFGITYPNGPDRGSLIGRAFGITGVPETFFIDPQGKVAFAFPIPIDRASLTAALEELLA